jgi:opacity protein-like surface antigen
MKPTLRTSCALIGATVLVPCIAQAQSQAPANYAAFRLGTSNNDISGLQAINPRVTSVTGTTIQNAGLTSLAVGHRYRNNWRAELEYSDRRSANMVVSTLGAGFSGRNELKVKSWSVMANGYYDYPLNERFTLFGQLGLGYSRLSMGG